MHRCKVKNSSHPCSHQQIGYALGLGRRGCDDPNVNLPFLYHLSNPIDMEDLRWLAQFFRYPADYFWGVDIEGCNDFIILLQKILIREEGGSQLSQTKKPHLPL